MTEQAGIFEMGEGGILSAVYRTAGDIVQGGTYLMRPLNWAMDKIDSIPFLASTGFHFVTSATHGLETSMQSVANDLQDGKMADLEAATTDGLNTGIDYAADMIPFTDVDTNLANGVKQAVGLKP